MPQPDENFFASVTAVLRNKDLPDAGSIFSGSNERGDAGIKVYRNNIRTSLSRALEANFPVIHSLVGDAFFKALALEYFYAHPPTSPLISHYGDEFPEFLTTFEPARALAYLPDMARLEIAWLQSYHAEDAKPARIDEVISAAENADIGALKLRLHPSLRVISSPYSIGSIWRRHHRGAGEEKLNAATPECVLVARKDNQVAVEIIPQDIFAAIAELANGEPLSKALAQSANPQTLFETLFLHDGVIAATTSHAPKEPSS